MSETRSFTVITVITPVLSGHTCSDLEFFVFIMFYHSVFTGPDFSTELKTLISRIQPDS